MSTHHSRASRRLVASAGLLAAGLLLAAWRRVGRRDRGQAAAAGAGRPSTPARPMPGRCWWMRRA